MSRVMNVDEVARYLRVVPDTIYRKARRGEIPAVKMGKVWRFPKETLDKWLNDAALDTVNPVPRPNGRVRGEKGLTTAEPAA